MNKQTNGERLWRQFMALLLVLLLGACGVAKELGKDLSTLSKGLREGNNLVTDPNFVKGAVAADEPLAAQVGRDILANGGNAIDAASAMYFTLAVTMPSSASLGGGGVCVMRNGWTGAIDAIDFTAKAPKTIPPTADRPSAVPGNIRGFFAMQTKHGRLRWRQIISPAENLARFGFKVSRAFASDLAKVENALAAEPAIRSIFKQNNANELVKEGDLLRQNELAVLLGRIRSIGPDDFYSGQTAAKFVAAVNAAGGSLSIDDLNNYHPTWLPAIAVPFSDDKMLAYFAPPPAVAGALAAEMWSMLTQNNTYADAPPDEKNHLFAETALRAFASREQWLRNDATSSIDISRLASAQRAQKLMTGYNPQRHVAVTPAAKKHNENPAATSFAVIDEDGYGVACATTMNNLFGTGRVASGSGIILAALPTKSKQGAISLGPVLITDIRNRLVFFAGAASGGISAPTALVSVLARTQIDEIPLEKAIVAKRVHHSGTPDITYYEQGLGKDAIKNLHERGHRLAATKTLAKVNAVSCFEGIPGKPELCSAQSDPRGFGLAIHVGY